MTDVLDRLRLCTEECDAGTCLFNPNGICLRPLLGLSPAVNGEDGCLGWIANEAVDGLLAAEADALEKGSEASAPSVRESAMLLKHAAAAYCSARLAAKLCDGTRCENCFVTATKQAASDEKKKYVGAIEFLFSRGDHIGVVGERVEYDDAAKMASAIISENHAGAPMEVVFYSDEDGKTIDFVEVMRSCDPPVPYRIEPDPRGRCAVW